MEAGKNACVVHGLCQFVRAFEGHRRSGRAARQDKVQFLSAEIEAEGLSDRTGGECVS